MSFNDPTERLRDIINNIQRIQTYTLGFTSEKFVTDHRTQDAVERCIARISEAAIKLGQAAEDLCRTVAWRDIRGIGNHLRHAYDGIEAKQIWNVVQNDLQPLLQAVETAIVKLK